MRFGELYADIPARDNTGLTVAKNCIPSTVSYRSFSSPEVFSSALNSACRGAIAVSDASGNSYNYSMSGTKLYRLVGTTMTDCTRSSGGDYAVESYHMAEFAEWGNKVIACFGINNGSTCDIQIITKGGTNFADLGGTPPEARHIGIVRNFVVLGGVHNGTSYPSRVAWSAIEDETGWTAGTNQSDYQDLQSGGNVMKVIGGEYGTIFCQSSIWRMTYVGYPLIFQFDEIEPGRGTIASGSVINYGESTFYLGVDGFYRHSGGVSLPIGTGKIDKTFFADVDQNYLWKITSAIDPINTLVFWAYPGSGNLSGLCNRMMVYNWTSDRWSGPIEVDTEVIYQSLSTGVTLEGIATLGYTNLDTLPYSLDSRFWQGGSVMLSCFDSAHKLSNFVGDDLDATFETGEAALSHGRALVTAARPHFDGTSTACSMQIGTRNNGDESVSWSAVSTQHPRTGLCNFRVDAYYHRVRMVLQGGFEHAYGADIEFEPSGSA